jgi:hypothetical protein
MATKADKWAQNAGGKFYVDQQCIDCDLCRETAPAFFTRHDEGGVPPAGFTPVNRPGFFISEDGPVLSGLVKAVFMTD